MSHTSTVKTPFTDERAIREACREMGLPEPQHGTHNLYGSNTATGLAVKLNGWRAPFVIDLKTGTVSHDKYGNNHTEADAQYNRFTHLYGVQKALAAAQRVRGAVATRMTLPNGVTRVRVMVR